MSDYSRMVVLSDIDNDKYGWGSPISDLLETFEILQYLVWERVHSLTVTAHVHIQKSQEHLYPMNNKESIKAKF